MVNRAYSHLEQRRTLCDWNYILETLIQLPKMPLDIMDRDWEDAEISWYQAISILSRLLSYRVL